MKSHIIFLLALVAIFFGITFLNANFLIEDKTTGDRFCINSAAMEFKPAKVEKSIQQAVATLLLRKNKNPKIG